MAKPKVIAAGDTATGACRAARRSRSESLSTSAAWVLLCLDDICSNLSAIHGIRDTTKLGSAALFTIAVRLPAYRGAIAARLAILRADEDGEPAASPAAKWAMLGAGLILVAAGVWLLRSGKAGKLAERAQELGAPGNLRDRTCLVRAELRG
jgi:hypothetical protein